jgi:hypothetical protein
MYINEEEIKQKPFIGEIVSLGGSVTPILGGSCDYPVRFDSERGAVYVPNNSVLMRSGKFYQVKIEPNAQVENASEFGFHKNGISMFRLKEGKLEREIPIWKLEGKKLRFIGLSADL